MGSNNDKIIINQRRNVLLMIGKKHIKTYCALMGFKHIWRLKSKLASVIHKQIINQNKRINAWLKGFSKLVS